MRCSKASLMVLAVLLLSISAADAWNNWWNQDGYDYIVVGSGAAGAIIATRLAKASPYNKVLVIDGGIPSQSSVGGTDFVAPSYSFNSQGEAVFNRPLTRYDVPAFTYSATADFPGSPTPVYPLDSTNGPVKTFSKLLGGNSVHNYMVWTRMTPKSLNNWNLTGWSYNDLLPYFKRVEDVRNTTVANDTVNHGFTGPIEITNAQVPDPIGQAFIQGCGNAGYKKTPDINSPTQYEGCGLPLFNINRRGIRGGAVQQYLAPALKLYNNLDITIQAVVTKVLFDTSCNPPKAIGVQYEKDGQIITVYASKEVILSAGAVGSVKTLLLSGVGPSAQLASLGIPLIADLPVGKNMSTHPIIFTSWAYNPTGVNPYGLSNSIVEYSINGTGVYASISVPAMANLKSNPKLDDIDLHVQVALSGARGTATLLALRLQFQRDLEIKIRSKDPKVAPFLTFVPFTRNEDITAFVNTVKIFRNITRVAPANAFFGAELSPGPQYQTDAQLAAWVRANAQPILTHLHSGARMGNSGDAGAVLDNRARVRKVTNLRVCDSSIFVYDIHALPTHNIAAFAEKVADMIIADN